MTAYGAKRTFILKPESLHRDILNAPVAGSNSAANTAPPSSRQPLREGINVSFAAADNRHLAVLTFFKFGESAISFLGDAAIALNYFRNACVPSDPSDAA